MEDLSSQYRSTKLCISQRIKNSFININLSAVGSVKVEIFLLMFMATPKANK